MVWKVRADCTYTTAANKTSAQSAVQTAIDAHPVTPVAGRFGAGLVSLSTTRFTLSVDVPDMDTALSLQTAINSGALSGKARSATLFSFHDAGDA